MDKLKHGATRNLKSSLTEAKKDKNQTNRHKTDQPSAKKSSNLPSVKTKEVQIPIKREILFQDRQAVIDFDKEVEFKNRLDYRKEFKPISGPDLTVEEVRAYSNFTLE